MTTTVLLNADQTEIRAVARSFLGDRFPPDRVRELMATEDGYDVETWREIADLGWAGIAFPEELGGAGYTIVERCLLLEEMGRVLCPVPFLSSAVLAGDAIALAADPERGGERLAAIIDGSARATLVAAGDLLGGAEPAGDVTATATPGGHALAGSGGLTLDGAGADTLIVAAALEDGEIGLFAVEPDAGGVARTPAPTIDETRRTAFVTFDGAPAERLDSGEGGTAERLAAVLDRGALSLAAEMVGGAQRAIEMTVEYMNEREQFGRPIGTFQALKHRLADLFVAIDAARESVYAAADAAAADAAATGQLDQLATATAVAKASASDGYALTGAEAVQLHGGIGFTEEHDIGLFYKRALVGSSILGTALHHRTRIRGALDV